MSWTIGEPVTVLRQGQIEQGRVERTRPSVALGPMAAVRLSGALAAGEREWFIFASNEGVSWARGHGRDVEAALLLTGSAAT